jgi:uncharacterized protein (DUF2062 family)
MKKPKENNNILRFLKIIYIKLFRINDTPQRVAIGFGIGVFCGIVPGMGPLASLFLAMLLRVNRASALLGSLLTNTWLSIVTFFLSIKTGAVIMNVNWQDSYNNWLLFLKDFRWLNLIKLSVLKIILPVIVGYLAVAFCTGLLAYLIILVILKNALPKTKK